MPVAEIMENESFKIKSEKRKLGCPSLLLSCILTFLVLDYFDLLPGWRSVTCRRPQRADDVDG
jgi:hypothetical protein